LSILHYLLSLLPPPKNIRNVIVPVILCGHETGSDTLNEEHRVMIFEKRVLRKEPGVKRKKRQGNGKTCRSESFIT
jgi:hypothetical protein